MSAGYDFSMAVTADDGELWSCGLGTTGELGLGNTHNGVNQFTRVGGVETFGPGGVHMVSCGLYSSLTLSCDNRVWTCGNQVRNEAMDSERVSPLKTPCRFDRSCFGRSPIVLVSVGRDHNMVVTAAGRAYTWSTMKASGEVTALGYETDGTALTMPRELINSEHFKCRVGRWHRERIPRIVAF